MSNPTLAVTYRRVSTADQRDHGYGLEAQAATLRQFVRREGLTVAADFADPGVSGTTPLDSRPGLSAALDTVLRTGAGVLVVARHDRLARDTLVALLIERAFADAGCRILYADGTNGESDTDRFTRTVLHAAAEQGKRETVRRLRAGREAKLERNAHAYVGGRPPFGYRADRQTHELVIDAQAAPVVRAIFERARRGQSVRAVAQALTAEGAAGRRWYPTQVARILAHEAQARASRSHRGPEGVERSATRPCRAPSLRRLGWAGLTRLQGGDESRRRGAAMFPMMAAPN